jgi:hypothetical protein
MPTRLLRLCLATVLVAIMLGMPAGATAQGTITFFISGVDASHFPDITFQMRAVDLNNQVVSNLSNTNISVYENGQLVPGAQVTPHTDGPLNVIFAVDLGRFSRFHIIGFNNARLAISSLVSGGYFVDGRDSVEVLARQNITSDQTVVLWPSTQTGTDLTNFAANFSFPRSNGNTKGLLVVDDAVTAMKELVPVPGSEAAAIVFLTRYIEDPNQATATTAAATLAQTARANFVNVFALQFDTSGSFTGPLQALTSGANGTTTPVSANNIVAAANTIYQTLNSQRTTYTVTYRSPVGTTGARTITINAPEAPDKGVAGSYEVNIAPPTVSILQPVAQANIQRAGKRDSNGNTVFDVNAVTVTAGITWPDGVAPRAITKAQLFANGALQDEVTPPQDATEVDLHWDITDITQPGSNPVQLEVKLTDELGIEVSGTSAVSILVSAAPPPAATATAKTEVIPPAVKTAVPYAAIALVCLGALAVVAVAGFVLMRRPPQPAAGRARGAARGAAADHTMIVGGPGGAKAALAQLTVLEGPRGMVGEKISLTKPITVIGRNPDLADVVFYPEEGSSLSRVHCTIQLDGRFFVITDSNSTNGTRVNGQLLKPSDPVQLRDGDEVVLGDLGKLGVKLRFNTAGGGGETDIRDRTYIVDDFEQQDFDKFRES